MRIRNEIRNNENGSYTRITRRSMTNEDGFVDANEFFERGNTVRKRFIKGKAFSFNYETNNPEVTKPFVIWASVIVSIVSIILIMVGIFSKNIFLAFFGIMTGITIFCFITDSMKDIHKIEKNIKENKQEKDK